MITKVVVCDSLREAFYYWHKFAAKYYDTWVEVHRKPMSLVSNTHKYIFHSQFETDYLRRYSKDDFVSANEFDISREDIECQI